MAAAALIGSNHLLEILFTFNLRPPYGGCSWLPIKWNVKFYGPVLDWIPFIPTKGLYPKKYFQGTYCLDVAE